MKRRHDSYWPDETAPAAWVRIRALLRRAGREARRLSAVEIGLIVALIAVIAAAVAGTLDQTAIQGTTGTDPVFAPTAPSPSERGT